MTTLCQYAGCHRQATERYTVDTGDNLTFTDYRCRIHGLPIRDEPIVDGQPAATARAEAGDTIVLAFHRAITAAEAASIRRQWGDQCPGIGLAIIGDIESMAVASGAADATPTTPSTPNHNRLGPAHALNEWLNAGMDRL